MTHTRRLVSRPVLAASFACVLATCAYTWAADWPQYRGWKSDGRSFEPAIAKAWPEGGPRVLWKVPVGEGFGTFAVSGERAFLFADRGGKETAICMDAGNGNEIWAVPLDESIEDRQGGSNPRSTPAIDGDNVYFFTVNLKLACLAVADGRRKWELDIKRDYKGQNLKWGNAASPVLDGDRIYVAGGERGRSMRAVNKNTGRPIWAVGSETITHASPVPATIHGVRQAIFFMKDGLVSLDSGSGRELWRYKFPFNVSTAASPVVGGENGDIVFCSAGYDVGAAAVQVRKNGNAFSAAQIWRTPGANMSHWSTPLHYQGHLYGIFGFKEYSRGPGTGAPLKCVDIMTGKEKWSQDGFGSGGGTILVDGLLLAQGDGGLLALVEATPEGYREKGRVQLPGEKFWSAAVVANGKIYARSKDEAFCLDAMGK